MEEEWGEEEEQEEDKKKKKHQVSDYHLHQAPPPQPVLLEDHGHGLLPVFALERQRSRQHLELQEAGSPVKSTAATVTQTHPQGGAAPTISTPYDHQSALCVCPRRFTTSGAMYSTVPQNE